VLSSVGGPALSRARPTPVRAVSHVGRAHYDLGAPLPAAVTIACVRGHAFAPVSLWCILRRRRFPPGRPCRARAAPAIPFLGGPGPRGARRYAHEGPLASPTLDAPKPLARPSGAFPSANTMPTGRRSLTPGNAGDGACGPAPRRVVARLAGPVGGARHARLRSARARLSCPVLSRLAGSLSPRPTRCAALHHAVHRHKIATPVSRCWYLFTPPPLLVPGYGRHTQR